MNTAQPSINLFEESRRSRDATLFAIVIGVIYGIASFYALFIGALGVLGAFLPVLISSLTALWLIGLRRTTLAGTIFIAIVSLLAFINPVSQAGLGIQNAITALALFSGCVLTTIPRRYIGWALISGLILHFQPGF